MRTRDMESLMLIDKVIEHKRLKLRGKKDSLYSVFNVISKGEDGYDDSNSYIKYKSIDRGVKRLCDAKIFVKDSEGYYSINPEYIVLEKQADVLTWRKFFNELAESGEFETYLALAKHMSNPASENYLDESSIRLYQKTIRENLDSLKADKDLIKTINEALKNDWKLDIEHKGKQYSVIPICYVISRDATRTYLYAVRKKEIQAFELQHIKVKGHTEKKLEKKEDYKNKVKECWDIDTLNPKRVKILYDQPAAVKNYLDEKSKLEMALNSHFGNPYINSNGQYIYEGEVRGMNDFKKWIRQYSEYCFVIEPQNLREEIIKGLKMKKERYEYEQRD